MGNKIPIFLVFHNALPWTELCIKNIRENTDFNQYRLIVIDNGSSDGISNRLKSKLIDGEVFERLENAVAVSCIYNRMAKKYAHNEECFVIIHNDVVVTKGWLQQLYSHFETVRENGDNSYAIFPRTNYCTEGTSVTQDEGLRDVFVKNKISNKSFANLDMVQDSIRKSYIDVEGLYEYSRNVYEQNKGTYKISEELCTFCTLFDSQMFLSSGGFDEDFISPGFDSELFNYKMSINGRYPIFALDTFVHHNGNTTTDGPGKDFLKDREKARCLCLKKKTEISDELIYRSKISTSLLSKGKVSLLAIRDDGIGDIIMSMFGLNSLKNKYQSVSISYMTKSIFMEFVSRFRCINRCLPMPEGFVSYADIESISGQVMKMNRNFEDSFDIVYNWIKHPEMFDLSDKHRILKFISSMKIKGIEPLCPEYTIKEEDEQSVDELAPNCSLPRVAIAPFASCRIRSMTKDLWQGIVEEELKDKQVILLHDSRITDIPSSFFEYGPKFVDLTGKLKLEHLPYLVSTCQYVYTPDSGLFHICGMMGVPTRAFFGSIEPSLRDGYYPSTSKNKIYYKKDLICVPCEDIGCDDVRCMSYSKKEIRDIVREGE